MRNNNLVTHTSGDAFLFEMGLTKFDFPREKDLIAVH